jgi:triacylglycerol lipase
MLTSAQAAGYGLLVNYAMDMYRGDRANLMPAPDLRLTDWKIVTYLTASDCLFRRGQTLTLGDEVCYGFLAQNVTVPTEFVVVIRGTDGILEWIDDADFISIAHPVAGRVEQGFWRIYASMASPGEVAPAAIFIAKAVNAVEGATLTVIGHSLGSALASYLTFELAAAELLGAKVSACLFASPRPGDAAFAKAFDARVATYEVRNYELDAVPRVPLGPDYTDLLKVIWIGIGAAQARISFTLPCHHHMLCYAAMLDYELLDWGGLSAIDHPFAACIKGPAA